MYAASRRKQTPTTLRARLSFSSRRCTSASTDILHSKTDPDVTSMKLSIPKPTSKMLPAIAPATTATRPSKAFHVMVKYSSLRPWRIDSWPFQDNTLNHVHKFTTPLGTTPQRHAPQFLAAVSQNRIYREL